MDPGTDQLAVLNDDGRVGVLTDITLAEAESLTGLEVQLKPGATLRVSHTNEQLRAGCNFFLNGHVVAIEALEPEFL